MGSPPRRGNQADLPATMCPLPWINLSLDVDGSSRPCCKFAHLDEGSSYQLANLRDADLPAVWNSDAMQRLRRDFRAGQRPEECATCWDEEAAGVPSWRQTFVADRNLVVDVDYDDAAPDQPVALDLKLSNTCNLRCRICGPVASSSWLAEEVAARGEDVAPHLVENRAYFKAPKLVDRVTDLGELGRWADGLQHIEMTGGEPMLSLENRRLVEVIAEQGEPRDVTLLITTNATVIDEAMVRWFPQFRQVEVVLSIDDIGARLTYQRAPADWGTVRDTLDRWTHMPGVGGLGVNCSVSVFNVWDLAEVLDWFSDHHPTLGVHLNLVHNPSHLSVRALPPPLRRSVASRLRRYSDDATRPADLRRQVDDLVAFIERGDGDEHSWRETLHEIHDRDAVRNERFADVYRDFWAEIERLDLASIGEDRRPREVLVGIVRGVARRLSP